MAAISVVIPAYNRESTLSVTLDSLLAQTHADWEAIVVDDGSSDGTYAIAAAYATRDPRIKVEHQANRGVSAARNAALTLASYPWVYFLDADDWAAPRAFELLASALERTPAADFVLARCVRVMADGTEVRERPPPRDEDLFFTFAETCAFSIHTCMVKRELVLAVGGFDETLVTCEDWDLWQRVVRTRPRVARIPDVIAFYRVRPSSASRNARRLLEDGLRVIARGHGNDPRLERWPGALHPGRSRELASSARLYLAAYAAGLALAAGEDARELLALVPDGRAGEVKGEGVAETLFMSIVEARAAVPAEWGSFPPDLQPRLTAFLEAMAEKTGDNWLAFTAGQALEWLVLEHASPPGTLVGRTQLEPVEVGSSLKNIELREGAQRVLLDVRWGGEKVGAVIVPAADGILPGSVGADAISDELSWDLLERFFARGIYSGLRRTQGGGRLTLHRGEVPLADIDDSQADANSVHSLVGWTVFLQELWGKPDWALQRFYEVPRSRGPQRPRRGLSAAPGALTVEISEDLPDIVRAADDLVVYVTLAGVPLMLLHVPPVRGQVSADALRRGISYGGGYELCSMAVREGVLADWPEDLPLRDRLRAAAQRRRADQRGDRAPPAPDRELWWPLLRETVPPGRRATVIGRRPIGTFGGSLNRMVAVPIAASRELVDAARAAGQPVFEFGDGAMADMAIYAPFVMDPTSTSVQSADPPPMAVTGAPEVSNGNGWIAADTDPPPVSDRNAVSHSPGTIMDALDRVTGRRRPTVPGGLRPRDGRERVSSVAVAEGATPAEHAAVPRPPTKRMPILMYHRVADGITGPARRWSVTPAQFEEQLAALAESGFRSLSIDDWALAGAFDRAVAGRPVMLTFDDGFVDFAENALPLLEKYRFRAEIFVVTGHVGAVNGWETAWMSRTQLMDWATLMALPRDVVRIGSHTENHRMLTSLSNDEVLHELVASRVTLEDRLGRAVSSIAYPYGPTDGAVTSLCGAAGYDFAYTTLPVWAHVGRDLLRLPRLEAHGEQSVDDFVAMLSQPF